MRLELHRTYFLPDRTIGKFYIDDKFFYWTLEDTDRYLERGGAKVPKETAIPLGKYKVTISFSNRYQRMMPHVLDVPQFTGIRIHAGNTPVDTEGCILLGVGYDNTTHNILRSKDAFNDFFIKLTNGLKLSDVWLKIE